MEAVYCVMNDHVHFLLALNVDMERRNGSGGGSKTALRGVRGLINS